LFDRNKISILQIQPFKDPSIRSFSNLISKHLHQKKKKTPESLKNHAFALKSILTKAN
jgi:predicted CopG family antitoxin